MSRVAHRFDRAAGSYDNAAQVQRDLGKSLLALYRRLAPGGQRPARILELGCGTGGFSEMLWRRFPEAEFLVTDAAPRMVAAAESRFRDRRWWHHLPDELSHGVLGELSHDLPGEARNDSTSYMPSESRRAGPIESREAPCKLGSDSQSESQSAFPHVLPSESSPTPLESGSAMDSLNAAKGMAKTALPDARFFTLDAVAPRLPDPSGKPIAMATSNAMVQWLPDLKAHFRALHDLLLPGGDLLVSGFSESNLQELRQSLRRIGQAETRAIGHSAEAVQTALEDEGYALKEWRAEEDKLSYTDPMAFFRALASLGATTRPGKEPLTRAQLRHLSETYRLHYLDRQGGVTATWSTWAFWAVRI